VAHLLHSFLHQLMHPCLKSKWRIKKKFIVKHESNVRCGKLTLQMQSWFNQIFLTSLSRQMNLCTSEYYLSLYKYSIKASCVSEYQVFLDLVSHFLKTFARRTLLNWSKGILPMFWIWKKSCKRLGQTWSNSIDLKQ